MSRPFLKMHGLGNDFVIIDGRKDGFLPNINFCVSVADRHRGVGFDQLIVLAPPQNPAAYFYLHMYNPDGSKTGACGNATRCLARLLFEETGKNEGVIQTDGGLLKVEKDKNGMISVHFGPPKLEWNEIPIAQQIDTMSVQLQGFEGTDACCVSMGNPHAVFFVKDINHIKIESIGPLLEHHPMFPKRANIEFAQIIEHNKIRMRVWERGTGVTQACGSGACATLVAAVRRGLSARRCTIQLDGGDLTVVWRQEDNDVILTGPTALSFTGMISDELIKD